MGSQTTSSRTYWTPTMERYFLDLMLEHMHRGNRTGHTFNKQAWTDILAVFNEKFETQYDKDVLKSRYANMWKQFNDIRNLLGQSGFSWDETTQMIVADDHVWDVYIKAYPDLRHYKNKVVLNFNDLCLVYCYTTADGRYSRSSHDIDIEDEGQGVNLGDGNGCLAPSNSDRLKTEWTPEMDQYLIELMLNQKERGNKVDNTFSKQAWADMLAMFNTKFGPQHGKRVLRHRYRKLWKYYSDLTVLLRQDGFSWDNTQQIVSADDDVWHAYIKANPNMRSYRTKMLPNYNDLGLIFGDAISGTQTDLQHDKDHEDDVVGSKAATERSRTYWTPPMDLYFIELLLDQVHRGNRIGQTFISQAWIDMVTSFNANFKSHYDKDVLKNRYKHLRRQYNAVKILLCESSFSWDETRQMVMAADTVWEAYLKEHPDARSFRVKTVPSYDKLCIIYGQDNPDGRCSHFSHDIKMESEAMLLTIGEGNDEHSLVTVDSIIDWGPSMDRYFIELLLEQTYGGNEIDHTFDDQAWAHMIASFNKHFVLQCDRYVLEDRYMCFMKQYIDVSTLLNQKGFMWDETQQMVFAADDVWKAYSKVHPNAISYRNKAVGNYNDLCVIFGTNETMHNHLCFKSVGRAFEQNPLDTSIVEASGDVHILTKEMNQRKRQSTEVPLPSGNSNKVQREMALDKATDIGAVTKLVNKNGYKNYIPVESAIDALQAIPEIDDELLLDACDLLEDERKAKTFLALDVTLRKKWLLRKLGR